MEARAIAIGFLTNVSLGNVNASHTEGNVMVAKKVTLPDGSTVPYISGQAVRRMLRDRLEDMGWQLSEPFSEVSGQEVKPPVKPWIYIDEDVFGYMDTDGRRRRTSPLRVSSLVGLFKFQGDRDLGTRSFEKFGKSMEAGGNMFETEIYSNIFKGNMLLELDRVGFYKDNEVWDKKQKLPEGENFKVIDLPENIWGSGRKALVLDEDEKKRRIEAVLEALKYLWGGGRTARMLVDLSPKFIAIMFSKVKHPVFLETMKVEPESEGFEIKYSLSLEPLVNSINKLSGKYEYLVFGIEPRFFSNEQVVKETLSGFGDVFNVIEAIDKAKAFLNK